MATSVVVIFVIFRGYFSCSIGEGLNTASLAVFVAYPMAPQCAELHRESSQRI